MFEPSVYQRAVFDFIQQEDGSAIVNAVAGSGKTTTLLQALSHIPTGKRVLFVAFNKSIVNELVEKAPKWVDVKTFNGIGYGTVKRAFPMVRLDEKKVYRIANELLDEMVLEGECEEENAEWFRRYSMMELVRLVKFARIMGAVPDTLSGRGMLRLAVPTDQFLSDIMSNYDIDIEEGMWSQMMRKALSGQAKEEDDDVAEFRTFFFDFARRVLHKVFTDTDTIDFDDQIVFPYVFQLSMRKYDYIFVDEAQDTNELQRELLEMMLDPRGGRLLAVGDIRQAIYAWRGADANAMKNIQSRFGCKWLPLSISYRCPQRVVQEAQTIVADIEAWDRSPEGSVSELMGLKLKDVRPGDAMLCRYNAPIYRTAYALLRMKAPVVVIGRDIGAQIRKFVERFNVVTITELEEKLEAWYKRETRKAEKKGDETKLQMVEDKYETVKTFMDIAPGTSVNSILQVIDEIYQHTVDRSVKDSSQVVSLSTLHRAKGMEFDRVFFLDADRIPCRHAKRPEQIEQEMNLRYIGITRAKRDLFYVKSKNIG